MAGILLKGDQMDGSTRFARVKSENCPSFDSVDRDPPPTDLYARPT